MHDIETRGEREKMELMRKVMKLSEGGNEGGKACSINKVRCASVYLSGIECLQICMFLCISVNLFVCVSFCLSICIMSLSLCRSVSLLRG